MLHQCRGLCRDHGPLRQCGQGGSDPEIQGREDSMRHASLQVSDLISMLRKLTALQRVGMELYNVTLFECGSFLFLSHVERS
jgi:hypothetical protein